MRLATHLPMVPPEHDHLQPFQPSNSGGFCGAEELFAVFPRADRKRLRRCSSIARVKLILTAWSERIEAERWTPSGIDRCRRRWGPGRRISQRRSRTGTGITRASGPGCVCPCLSGPLTATGPSSALSACRVCPHHAPNTLGCPLISLHPGASRCRYLMTGCDSPVQIRAYVGPVI
jgi:hypothetical protein